MTAPYALVAFWEVDETAELPIVGTTHRTTSQQNAQASLFKINEPLSVVVESHCKAKGNRRGFIGRLDRGDFDEEEITIFKKRGLFQLAWTNRESKDPMKPPPPRNLFTSRSIRLYVYGTSVTSDLERFATATASANDKQDGVLRREDLKLIQFREERQDWQPTDYLIQWHKDVLQDEEKEFYEKSFILMGDERHSDDPEQDVVKVVVQLTQEERKDPIRTYRCTIRHLAMTVPAMDGLGDDQLWLSADGEVLYEQPDAVLDHGE